MTNGGMNAEHQALLPLVSRFHSILNTAWPKPGVPEMRGASVFIGTSLFKSLENGMGQIQNTIQSLPDPGLRGELIVFWNAFSVLFFRLGAQDRSKSSDRVDYAFNLLYLASGVLYHRVAHSASKLPLGDERLVGVEELPDLIRLCGWPDRNVSARSVFDSLVKELIACAANLEPAVD